MRESPLRRLQHPWALVQRGGGGGGPARRRARRQVLLARVGVGAFLGGGGRRTGTAIRSAGRAARSRQDVAHAEETADAAREQLAELEQEFEGELQKLELASDAEEPLEEEVIRPPLNAISLRVVALAWLPYGVDAAGQPVPLWR